MMTVGDMHESEQTARDDRRTRMHEVMVKAQAAALDMIVDRTSMGLTGAHTSMKKNTTAVQDEAGRAMGMTIRSKRTEDKCIDRGALGGMASGKVEYGGWRYPCHTLILRMTFFFLYWGW